MRLLIAVLLVFALVTGPTSLQALAAETSATAAQAQPSGPPLDSNATCLGCHGNEGFSMPGADGKTRALHVAADKFDKSKHGVLPCIACHQQITEIPHKEG